MLKILPNDNLKVKPDQTKLGFGNYFTDNMLKVDYSPEQGWHNARIEPYGPFVLDPATNVLHYGQGVFEGLKVYRTAENKLQMFRPADNMKRMNRSNGYLCIPQFDPNQFVEYMLELVKIEKDWVPSEPGTSLYVRPTIISTDVHLGVATSKTYCFFVILSPVGAYYATGFKPIKIMVDTEHVRAVPGGMGDAKTMGNYAASLKAAQRAGDQGYNQVLWIDGVEHKYIEEVGSMNIAFVFDGKIVTPSLTGSFLQGITRDSVIKLAKDLGYALEERRITLDEVVERAKDGSMSECFGTGTAAVISAVNEIKVKDAVYKIGGEDAGPVAQHLYDTLTGIQYGRIADKFGWIVPVA